MGTYVATTTISPELREAHFEAIKVGGRLPRNIAPSIEAHLQYVKELSSAGKILASGLTVDFTWGLTIIIADSLDKAKCIARNDPGARAGLVTDIKVEPWYHMV